MIPLNGFEAKPTVRILAYYVPILVRLVLGSLIADPLSKETYESVVLSIKIAFI